MCWGKDKPDLQSSITKKAQELKTQQKRVIDKAFQEKQKEKYEARLEFQRKTLEVQQWKKKHIENLLRVTISLTLLLIEKFQNERSWKERGSWVISEQAKK